jgi:hypothetical protein
MCPSELYVHPIAYRFEEFRARHVANCQSIMKRGAVIEAKSGFVCICKETDKSPKGIAEVGGGHFVVRACTG